MRLPGERRHSINGKPDTYDLVLADLNMALDAYEHVLWLYAEGICRCLPDRLEYLMSVELPFLLTADVLVDLELLVSAITTERSKGYSQKVAA